MARLKAPKSKVLPWLDEQADRFRTLLALPIDTPEDRAAAEAQAHRFYLVLFDGLQRGFKRDDTDELNPNKAIMRSAYTGHLEEHQGEAFQVYIGGMLAVIEEARAVALNSR